MIAHNSKHCLSIHHLAVSRSDIPIFDPVSFQLSAGECIQISGANGVGKTTLLRAICGIGHHYEGSILWCGQNNLDKRSKFNENALYLGHALGLKPKLTAEQNLNFYRELRFKPDPELIRSALTDLGLDLYHDEYVARMSAGQKRRVALSRIKTEPVPLWILDEPMAALDVKGQAWLESTCNQHLDGGGLILITSHQPITGINGLRELTLS